MSDEEAEIVVETMGENLVIRERGSSTAYIWIDSDDVIQALE